MKYSQVNLKQTIEGVTGMAESAEDKEVRNVLFSARDYLVLFQTETENQALAWDTILKCKKQKGNSNE